jgi:hypothetical protein
MNVIEMFFDDARCARRLRFWVQNGALMCSQFVAGLTQDLACGSTPDETMAWYGGRWFVCETLFEESARLIAEALGGELVPAPFRKVS